MTYISLDSREEAQRFSEECERLGYPIQDYWPHTGEQWFDPEIPEDMPRDLYLQARDYAKFGGTQTTQNQHPGFKYLKVPIQ